MKRMNQQIQEVLKANELELKQNPSTSGFEESLKKFKKMVKDGIVKPRGYNLQSVENMHQNTNSFNMNV